MGDIFNEGGFDVEEVGIFDWEDVTGGGVIKLLNETGIFFFDGMSGISGVDAHILWREIAPLEIDLWEGTGIFREEEVGFSLFLR